MKYQLNDFVIDSVSCELVGFANLGDNMNILQSNRDSQLTERAASKVLAFMVNGIASPLKCSLAYFATKSCTGSMVFCLEWKAIGYLGYVCFKVIAIVSDKATANHSFYKMHPINKIGLS